MSKWTIAGWTRVDGGWVAERDAGGYIAALEVAEAALDKLSWADPDDPFLAQFRPKTLREKVHEALKEEAPRNWGKLTEVLDPILKEYEK